MRLNLKAITAGANKYGKYWKITFDNDDFAYFHEKDVDQLTNNTASQTAASIAIPTKPKPEPILPDGKDWFDGVTLETDPKLPGETDLEYTNRMTMKYVPEEWRF